MFTDQQTHFASDSESTLLSSRNLDKGKGNSQTILGALLEEVRKHKRIRFNLSDWLDLLVGCSSSQKMNKLYNVGMARVEADLNVVRIVKKIRHLDVISNCSTLLKSKERRFQVAHTYQNVIDLDDEGSASHRSFYDATPGLAEGGEAANSDEDRKHLKQTFNSARQFEGGEIESGARNNSNNKRERSRSGGKTTITVPQKIQNDFKVKSGTGGTKGNESGTAGTMMYPNVSSVKKSQVYQSGLDGMEDFDDASFEGNVYNWKE